MKKFDVSTFGETMVAFNPISSKSIEYSETFKKDVAGAESNTAIVLAKLGINTCWTSVVGEDAFGSYIIKKIRGEGVNVDYVKKVTRQPTGLMFKECIDGDNSSVFYYRQNSALQTFKLDTFDLTPIKNSKILHLSGILPSMNPNFVPFYLKLIDFARENNILVSFDPNIRLKIADKNFSIIQKLISLSDIVMLGLDEAKLIYKVDTIDEVFTLINENDKHRIAVKNGSKGTISFSKENGLISVPAIKVNAIESVGAGDAFNAGFLAGTIEGFSLEKSTILGNIVGGLATTSFSDTDGIPGRKVVYDLLENKQLIYR